MCFHAEDDFDQWKIAQRKRGASEKAVSNYRQVVMRHTTPEKMFGKFAHGWPVDVRDHQEVANVINELREWHPDGDKVVDLKDVNERRVELGLEFLDANGLPLPNRAPRESIDVDDALKEQNERAKLRAGINAMEQMKRKRKVAGQPDPMNDDALSPATKAQRARERAELAESLGITVEELNTREREQVREIERA